MMHAQGLPFIHMAGDLLVRSGFALGPRTITDFELVYFPEATGTVYEIGGISYTLDKPGFVFTRPNEIHRYGFDSEKNVRHLFVHFDYDLLRQPASPLQPLLHSNWIPADSHRLVALMIKRMLLAANLRGSRWEERITTMLASALEELCASAELSDGHPSQLLPLPIARALTYMQEHLGSAISVEEIARQSGWSHEHFTRVFTSCIGMPPKRALLERRLQRSEQLMMEGRLSIKEIAYEVGFGDVHHFSRTYKSVRGITATRYIDKCKDPLFRNTTASVDPDTPYPLNRHVHVNEEINNMQQSFLSPH